MNTVFVQLNHVSESLLPHLYSPSLQQEPAVSTPFCLDLPEQELPHPTLGPYLSHSVFLPPPSTGVQETVSASLAEEVRHKPLVLPTVQAVVFYGQKGSGEQGGQGKTFAHSR